MGPWCWLCLAAHPVGQVVEVPVVEARYAIFDLDAVFPAEGMQFGDVGQFAHGAIRFGCVKGEFSAEPGGFDGQSCQVPDGKFLAGADVDVAVAYLGPAACQIGKVYLVHDVNTGVCHVFTPQKLAQGGAGAPEFQPVGIDAKGGKGFGHFRHAVGVGAARDGAAGQVAAQGFFVAFVEAAGKMRFADHGGQDVAVD